MVFEKLKNDILGRQYSLSIAYVSEKKSREINKKYRKLDRATNVLSFSLRKQSGELVLCKALIKKEAKSKSKEMRKTFGQYLGFLVIHGMLHLKGMKHGSIMKKLEEKYDQKYFGRNRHGLKDNKSRGGRISKRRKKS